MPRKNRTKKTKRNKLLGGMQRMSTIQLEERVTLIEEFLGPYGFKSTSSARHKAPTPAAAAASADPEKLLKEISQILISNIIDPISQMTYPIQVKTIKEMLPVVNGGRFYNSLYKVTMNYSEGSQANDINSSLKINIQRTDDYVMKEVIIYLPITPEKIPGIFQEFKTLF